MADIAQLIKKAAEVEATKKGAKRSEKSVIINRLEELGIGEIKLEKPSIAILNAARDRKGEEASLYTLSQAIISPDLGNKELQNAFKVNNKIALIKKIFTSEEIQDLVVVIGTLITEQETLKPAFEEVKN